MLYSYLNNTQPNTNIPQAKAYTDAFVVRRRRRRKRDREVGDCMDDPVGLVPVLEEPGAKVKTWRYTLTYSHARTLMHIHHLVPCLLITETRHKM